MQLRHVGKEEHLSRVIDSPHFQYRICWPVNNCMVVCHLISESEGKEKNRKQTNELPVLKYSRDDERHNDERRRQTVIAEIFQVSVFN